MHKTDRIMIQTPTEVSGQPRTQGFLLKFHRGSQSNSEVSKDGRLGATLVIRPAFMVPGSQIGIIGALCRGEFVSLNPSHAHSSLG